MKKIFSETRHKWYRRLSDKIESYIPKEYKPVIAIAPSIGKDTDMVLITLHIPHDMVKKLMWSFKVWKEN